MRSLVAIARVPDDLDREGLKSDVLDYLDTYGQTTLEGLDLTPALNDFTAIVRRHHIVLMPWTSMLIKVLVMLEGTAKLLDPGFSLTELLEPYYSKAVKRRLDPRRLLRRARSTYRDWDELLNELPRRLTEILARAERGALQVNLEHRRLDAVANRAVLGLLTAALLVASALLWSNDVPPRAGGISIVGAAGYVVAAFLGLRLLRAIRSSGDLGPKE
jgi:ubiquinone biosynthesis protein